tara:strand:+ start:1808 stop:2122 length:315 start_codon:yes stop_codon:yes gene_type:complete
MIGRKEFLTNRDETGREMVIFPETGKQYFIEYIEPRVMKNVSWGDVDPATKKLTGSYGGKSNGAIKEEDSMITKENGFNDIKEGKGSPYWKIQQMHNEYKKTLN